MLGAAEGVEGREDGVETLACGAAAAAPPVRLMCCALREVAPWNSLWKLLKEAERDDMMARWRESDGSAQGDRRLPD